MVPVHPGDDAGVRDSDRVRVGDRDRSLAGSRLLDPGDAGHLAVAVLRVEPGGHRVARIRLAAGMDGRDSGPYAVFPDQGLVADLDARDIGDRVVRAGSAAKTETQSAGARLARRGAEV